MMPANEHRPARATPRKRFQIQKLEERVAPRKGGKGTNNCAETELCGGGHVSSNPVTVSSSVF